jgi:hypothetical protein
MSKKPNDFLDILFKIQHEKQRLEITIERCVFNKFRL